MPAPTGVPGPGGVPGLAVPAPGGACSGRSAWGVPAPRGLPGLEGACSQGVCSRPTPKGQIEGDQVQVHTQGGN